MSMMNHIASNNVASPYSMSSQSTINHVKSDGMMDIGGGPPTPTQDIDMSGSSGDHRKCKTICLNSRY